MSQHKGTPVGEDFEQKLERLRMRIDLLPESHRTHLYELADTIKQQHLETKKHDHQNGANG